MNTPHKWADVIKAWADGKPIQCRLPGDKHWYDFNYGDGCIPGFNNPSPQWRIKPDVVKYRRYLTHWDSGPAIGVANFPYKEGSTERAWGKDFIRWIDTEWQEVEV